MATATDVLNRAAKEIGYSRWDDPKTGTIYGRWYAQEVGDSYFGQNGVPYCAMFVSYILDKCGQKVKGFPTASCPSGLSGARNAGLKISNKKNAKAGDIVFFDWNNNNSPDHVGFVEKNYGSYIQKVNNELELEGYQVLKIDTFHDMLEIRDTIQSPILMVENKEKTRTYFVIPSSKILYTYCLKVKDSVQEEEKYE